jgi:Spy/CpxP family protein refolding chaperone
MVIFGTGVVTGGLLVRHAEHGRDRRPQRAANAVRSAQPPTPGVMRFEFLRRMERELDLTPAQRGPIDKILQEGQERMKKLMETVEPHRRDELKKTIDEFRGVLTPEQQKRFDELLKQQQQRSRDQHKAAPPRERLPQSPPPAATNSAPSTP